MELPPYRMPMAKSLLIHMWDRGKLFLKKMGGLILVGSVLVWALSAFPRLPASRVPTVTVAEGRPAAAAEAVVSRDQRVSLQIQQSYMGRIGRVLAPVFAPMGIDWRGGVALLSGVVAKEIVVSTMGVLYGVEADTEDALGRALVASGMNALSALAMMAFVLLYLPCLATVAAIRREAGNGWMVFSLVYSTGLAWLVAVAIYQGGRLFGWA